MDDYIDPKVSAGWRQRMRPNRRIQWWKLGDQRRVRAHDVPRRPASRLWTQSGEADRTNLGEYLPLLNEHIELHLKAQFARILHLQLIHVAAAADVKHGVTVLRESGGFERVENYYTQRCADCLKQVPRPGQMNLPDSLEENECWSPGQRLLERMEGRMITDWRWWVLEPGEQPPPGFIPCKAAFEAL